MVLLPCVNFHAEEKKMKLKEVLYFYIFHLFY